MYKHILIPTDGSETAAKAVAAGIDFAREAHAKVTLFTAVPEYLPPSEAQVFAGRIVSLADHDQRSREKAERVVAAAIERARDAGIECDMDFAQCDRPYEAIVEAARRNGCDAIFMATHARKGLAALWRRSETAAVLRNSEVPTLVLR
ncbi:MAG TPA: universal stress protein [Burkholderiales bacterium]|nr:universal stress protein [Burkholderiales bacterium]